MKYSPSSYSSPRMYLWLEENLKVLPLKYSFSTFLGCLIIIGLVLRQTTDDGRRTTHPFVLTEPIKGMSWMLKSVLSLSTFFYNVRKQDSIGPRPKNQRDMVVSMWHQGLCVRKESLCTRGEVLQTRYNLETNRGDLGLVPTSGEETSASLLPSWRRGVPR